SKRQTPPISTSSDLSGKRGAFDRSTQHHLIDLQFKDGVAMSQQKRTRFSPAQITDVWRRWKAGQTQHEIGRAYGKPHPSIRCVLLPRGGIAPAARAPWRLELLPGGRDELSPGKSSW